MDIPQSIDIIKSVAMIEEVNDKNIGIKSA